MPFHMAWTEVSFNTLSSVNSYHRIFLPVKSRFTKERLVVLHVKQWRPCLSFSSYIWIQVYCVNTLSSVNLYHRIFLPIISRFTKERLFVFLVRQRRPCLSFSSCELIFKLIASIHLAKRVSNHNSSLENQEAATAHQLVLQVLHGCYRHLFLKSLFEFFFDNNTTSLTK